MRSEPGVVAVLTAALLSLGNPFAEGCGDKLLSIARGIRLQQAYKARHPAKMLLFVADAESAKTRKANHALIQMSILYMSLRQAGHKIEVAQNPRELDQALQTAGFQFVLADAAEVDTVTDALAALSAGTPVLPVLFKPSKADLAAAKAKFDLVLKTPATSTDHLEAIDRAMESRSGAESSGI